MSKLPYKTPAILGPLGELQRRGHDDAVVHLMKEWGGQNHYIPFKPTENSPVVKVIGMEAARALCDIIKIDKTRTRLALKGDAGARGECINIPSRRSLTPSLKPAILRHSGRTREVARELGCTEGYLGASPGAMRPVTWPAPRPPAPP